MVRLEMIIGNGRVHSAQCSSFIDLTVVSSTCIKHVGRYSFPEKGLIPQLYDQNLKELFKIAGWT